jgi:hypothetical protein
MRGGPDQRLTVSLFLRFWILLFLNAGELGRSPQSHPEQC